MNLLFHPLTMMLMALAATALLRLLLSLLLRYAKVYRTIGNRRHLEGYLIPNADGDLVLYSSLLPLTGLRKGIVTGGSQVRLRNLNDEQNYTEMPAGSTDGTNVIDRYGATVAVIQPTRGSRGSQAFCYDEEIAYARGSLRSGRDIEPAAAAVGALLANQAAQESPDVADEHVGMGDLVLPAAYIMLVLYYPIIILARSIGILYLPLLAIAAYLLILLGLYIAKYNITMNNGSFQWTRLIGDNVGMQWLNWLTIILGSALVVFGTSTGAPTTLLLVPAISILVIALCINQHVFPKRRIILDPYSGWRGGWRRKSFTQPATPSADLVAVDYSWADILSKKNITPNERLDTVHLQLCRTDFEGDSPRVRQANPFYPDGLLSEADRKAFTKTVLAGADLALSTHEDRCLNQIVNSAYQLCTRYNLADFEMYDLLLMFCQNNIDYRVDDQSGSINNIHEYYRFASETLYDRTGDCDCKAVLAYKLFELLGVKPHFVVAKTGGEENYNHAAIVLRNDPNALIPLPPQYKEYSQGKGVYCEATSSGFHPGDVPEGTDTSSLIFIER